MEPSLRDLPFSYDTVSRLRGADRARLDTNEDTLEPDSEQVSSIDWYSYGVTGHITDCIYL